MSRTPGAFCVAVGSCAASNAGAQGGDGSLRGSVLDDQGGALPGVTVTATSPALLRPSVAVTDGSGNYRFIRIAWVTYFNAGVRVVDLSDWYNLKELGYSIPNTNASSHPIAEGPRTAIQINDLALDHGRVAYATGRIGTRLFITNRDRRPATNKGID